MKGKVFVVDWDIVAVEEHAKHLFDDGWDVQYESVDGRRAFDLIKADHPDVVVIYLSAMPAYGRALADDMRSFKETSKLPIVFVDGKEKAVKKAMAEVPDCICTTQEDVLGELLRFRKTQRPRMSGFESDESE